MFGLLFIDANIVRVASFFLALSLFFNIDLGLFNGTVGLGFAHVMVLNQIVTVHIYGARVIRFRLLLWYRLH